MTSESLQHVYSPESLSSLAPHGSSTLPKRRISFEEYRELILARRRLVRIHDREGRERELFDPVTGESFVIDENDLRRAVRLKD